MATWTDDLGQGLRLAVVAVLSAVIVAALVIGAGSRLLPDLSNAPPSSSLQPAEDAGLRPWRSDLDRSGRARP
ncbi:hypothetical protein [Brevundimonas sp. PAMC22021]|uniref:hypothetical protein n=1 Tax=Brevundimonas sp. PAMC22021 TaxID=2861285 RepID=UPI001C627714|nr:hypothetical protein [Brevundimonas sp. PAMC22021]QYF86793.1 hypothetical protein KY493_13440 [Brevundimonas sp. PAMC22021]